MNSCHSLSAADAYPQGRDYLLSSDTIYLRNMQFYAFHGVNPEEKILGQRFEVDVALD